MRKVTSIHLNASAFLVEEQGYALLEAYLNAAEERSKNSPDKADIMKDLEQTIADKCRAYLSLTKDVVLTDEIKVILNEIDSAKAAQVQAHESNESTEKQKSAGQKLEVSMKTDSDLSVIWDDFASLIGIGGITLFFLLCWIVSAVSILLSSRFLSGTAHPFLSFLLVLLVTTCAIYIIYWPIRLLFEKWHKDTYGVSHPNAKDSRAIIIGCVLWIVASVIFLVLI